jgi:F0F1-type ATP synthase assembly protein I
MASLFTFILAHQGDAADPELIHWIKERLDQIFGTGPWTVIVVMGLIILAMPIFVTIVYLMQSKRRSADESPDQDRANHDEKSQERVP